MPRRFSFGIPSYFNFTFQAGPQFPSFANGTINVQSNSNVNADPESSNEIETLIPSPLHGTGNTVSSPCGTLNKLPLELRIKVYMNVLNFERAIKKAHIFLGRRPPIMAEDGTHIEAIDATLLRTCKAVYREALRILYAMNRFHFRNLMDIRDFAHNGMGDIPFGFYRTDSEPSSAVSKPCGRLTMIRFLSLTIGREFTGNDRQKIWSLWCDFFYPPEGQDQAVGFPALESLVLDLAHWGLNTGDAPKLRVTPFLKKLRPTGGLKRLTLIGVKHEQNLRDFKHGFVRQGGTFRPASSSVKTVPTVTVTHDDLPEVSMHVRAIVEKDKASRRI